MADETAAEPKEPKLFIVKNNAEDTVITTSVKGVKIWSTKGNELKHVKTLACFKEIETAQTFLLYDDKSLIVADEKEIKILSILDGKKLASHAIEEICCTGAKIDSKTILFGTTHGHFITAVWDGTKLIVKSHYKRVHQLFRYKLTSISAFNKHCLSVGLTDCKLWETDGMELKHTFNHQEMIDKSALNDNYVVTTTSECIRVFSRETSFVSCIIASIRPTSLHIHEHKNVLVSTESPDGRPQEVIQLYQLPKGIPINNYHSKADVISQIVLLNDGKIVVVGTIDEKMGEEKEVVQLIQVKELQD